MLGGCWLVERFGFALARGVEGVGASVEEVLELARFGVVAKQELDVAAVVLLFLDDDVPSDEILRVIAAEECRDIGAEVVSRFGIQRQISQHV